MQDRHVSVGRLVTSWGVGLTFSWLLLFGPPAAVGRALLQARARVPTVWGGHAERREIGRVADERWVARQRAAGPTGRTPAGEPVYAVARVGSAPPPAELRGKAERTVRVARRTMLAWGLLIPVLLLLHTRRWLRERRRLAELLRVAPAALGAPLPTERTRVATHGRSHVGGAE